MRAFIAVTFSLVLVLSACDRENQNDQYPPYPSGAPIGTYIPDSRLSLAGQEVRFTSKDNTTCSIEAGASGKATLHVSFRNQQGASVDLSVQGYSAGQYTLRLTPRTGSILLSLGGDLRRNSYGFDRIDDSTQVPNEIGCDLSTGAAVGNVLRIQYQCTQLSNLLGNSQNATGELNCQLPVQNPNWGN